MSQDEIKYFEVARQGSHELPAREHRGKVIKKIVEQCVLSENSNKEDSILEVNIKFLEENKIQYASLVPTETGLKKNILDAISNVRDFLNKHSLHNYDQQDFGPLFKVILTGKFKYPEKEADTEISLYRSNGRGDYRIWFSDLKSFVSPNENIILLVKERHIYILNISKYNYTNLSIENFK
ncbi:hypothetical protein D3C72_1338490 [compost metagenome]